MKKKETLALLVCFAFGWLANDCINAVMHKGCKDNTFMMKRGADMRDGMAPQRMEMMKKQRSERAERRNRGTNREPLS
jgi:hypothetical protein